MNEKKYGLFTSITMIVGIVIGSGIFFKSDDVLAYTNGNMLLGILVFLVAAFAIIFGSLTISQLASRSDKPGGIVSYTEEFVNVKMACAIGWFQIFLYFAPVVAVVAWVSGLYLCQLFGIEATNTSGTLIGSGVMVVLYLINAISGALGGFFQNATMIIKLIPLIIIAVAGLIFGEPGTIIGQDIQSIRQESVSTGMLAAFAPIAFSYDGWIVATSICHEIKNVKKNLPIAMILSPLIILVCYISYFVGITSLVGSENVLKHGNESTFMAATKVFGALGAKLILIFVVISILGTLNGLILAFIQMPYSLAIRNLIPFSNVLKTKSKKCGGMPISSAIFSFVLCLIWLLLNYYSQEGGIVGDVSEVPICISYLNFIILYVAVIKLTRRKEISNKFMGYFVPSMAIVGSLIILSGSITHPMFFFYAVVCLLVMGLGYMYSKNINR